LKVNLLQTLFCPGKRFACKTAQRITLAVEASSGNEASLKAFPKAVGGGVKVVEKRRFENPAGFHLRGTVFGKFSRPVGPSSDSWRLR